MDFLQQSLESAKQGFAHFRWQDWAYFIIGLGLLYWMVFVTPKMYPKVIARFERKHNVRISATFRSYRLSGPHPWLYLLWLELKLMFTLMFMFLFPIFLIGLVGLVLGVFET